MKKAKGIQHHPLFKLGKAPAKRDKRNLMLKAVLRVPVKLPAEYDFDLKHPGIPTPVFANDIYGNCVIAGRAHQTLRFEYIEQSKVLKITDQEVIKEYLKETGGVDSGLILHDSLGEWRKRGWIAAKKHYLIQAYAEIDRTSTQEVKRTIFMDLGAGIGLLLPRTAKTEFEAGKPWKKTTGSGSARGSWGGHYVYLTGYTTLGPTCVTWGRKQQMSWAFFKKYCDEAYAIIDAINTPKKRRWLDSRKLVAFLANVTKPQRSATRKKK